MAIRTNDPDSHQKSLELGLLDMVVDAEPRMHGNFTSWVLYEDRFNFYGKGFSSIELTPESAKDLTLIYCPIAFDHSNRTILQHLEEANYFFKEKIELDSFTSVATFAKTGIGLAVLPQRLAEVHSARKELSKVSVKGFSPKGFGTHSICVTVIESQADRQRIKLLVRMLRDWFKTS